MVFARRSAGRGLPSSSSPCGWQTVSRVECAGPLRCDTRAIALPGGREGEREISERLRAVRRECCGFVQRLERHIGLLSDERDRAERIPGFGIFRRKRDRLAFERVRAIETAAR